MSKKKWLPLIGLLLTILPAMGQDNPAVKALTEKQEVVEEWVNSLNLGDEAKGGRVIAVITNHRDAVYTWHNEHPFTTVPEGIDPASGRRLSELDRQFIADSAMPTVVHTQLMEGLRKELTEQQVEAILDKYTVGKVAFTMAGYKAIVPELTPEEEAYLLARLKEAREMAIDYKSMKLISMVFEIYKTKCEQYLIGNGRNWKALYKAFTDKIKAEKAAAAQKSK